MICVNNIRVGHKSDLCVVSNFVISGASSKCCYIIDCG